jgi:hypothetical protein
MGHAGGRDEFGLVEGGARISEAPLCSIQPVHRARAGDVGAEHRRGVWECHQCRRGGGGGGSVWEGLVHGGGTRYTRPAYGPRSKIGGSESGSGGQGGVGAGYANGKATPTERAGGSAVSVRASRAPLRQAVNCTRTCNQHPPRPPHAAHCTFSYHREVQEADTVNIKCEFILTLYDADRSVETLCCLYCVSLRGRLDTSAFVRLPHLGHNGVGIALMCSGSTKVHGVGAAKGRRAYRRPTCIKYARTDGL